MSKLALNVLGSVEILLDGEEIRGQLPLRAQAVLIYLAVTGQPQPRLRLASLLWPDVADSRALKNLRDVLPPLRAALGEHVLITRQSVGLNGERPYSLDIEALQTRTQMETLSLEERRAALGLYKGEFLADFYVPQAAPFEEWQTMWRERLHELAVQQIDLLVKQAIQAQKWEMGLALTQRLLELEPWRESAHYQRMLLFASTGNREAALTQYDLCRQTLADEFGLEPTAEIERLAAQIRAGELGKAEPTAVPSPPRLPHLPRPLTPFFGRQSELAQAVQRLRDPAYPLLTITGEGGIGKTRLAIAAAQVVSADFADGVWFVPLANVAETAEPEMAAEQLASAIDSVLGLKRLPGHAASTIHLQSQLQSRHMLLILDNFEHLIAGRGWLLDLLMNCPRLSVMITSRERLNAQAEAVLRLQGLPVPDKEVPVSLPTLITLSSLQLFTERASRITPDFILDEANLPAVVRICQLVEGLPLGIELAAMLTQYQSCAAIAEALTANATALAATWHDLPARHQSLQAVFAYSWQRLPEEQALTLAQCSVFQGGFAAAAGQAVTGAPFSRLTALAQKSLLRPLGNGRFDMHELIRHFAAEKLALLPENGRAIPARHSDYYLDFLQQRQAQLENETAVLREIQTDMHNIRAAWQWAVQQRQIDALHKAVPALAGFYRLTGLYREAYDAFAQAIHSLEEASATPPLKALLGLLYAEQSYFVERILNLNEAVQLGQKALAVGVELDDGRLQTVAHVRLAAIYFAEGSMAQSEAHSRLGLALAQGDEGLQRQHARSLYNLGRIAANRGDHAGARACYQEALGLAQKAGSRVDEGWLLNELGAVDWRQGEYEQADAYLQQGLTIVRSTGDRQTEADILKSLGIVAWFQGEYDAALQSYEASLSIYKEIGDRTGESSILNNMGLVAWIQADYERSAAYYEQSLRIKQEIGEWARAGTTYGNLGVVARAQGKYEQAIHYHQQSLAITEEAGDELGRGRTCNNLGVVAACLGQYEQAEVYYRQSLTIRQEIGDREGEATTLGNLGTLAFTRGDYGQAAAFQAQSLRIRQEIGDRAGECLALMGLGLVDGRLGRFEQARSRLETAVSLSHTLHNTGLREEALTMLADISLAQGQPAAARELLADVLTSLARGRQFGGAEYGCLNYLICYRVLQANEDERGREILNAAYEQIQAEKEGIQDAALRRSFVESVPWRQELLAEWKRLESAKR